MTIIGERDWLPCIASEIGNPSCTGVMWGTYGGQSYQACKSCGGKVTVRQYLNCTCEICQTSFNEVFEFCCNNCSDYGLSDRLSITDPDCDDISYSFSGVGYPLAEVDDLEELMLEAAVDMRSQIHQLQHDSIPNSDEF